MVTFPKIVILIMSQFSFIGISYAISWFYTKASMAYKTGFLVLLGFFALIPVLIFLIAQS